ncbi:MAG TPA: hypothetical protein VE133_14885 [Candidatus Sulfotelmatobacter sp.]|nr:hypothetical protein [Candidatus Sulfotelmatobacter sp.]
MPFPVFSHAELSGNSGLPSISFSIIGNQIDPTSYVVAVSETKVQPGQETTVKYTRLITGTDLDTQKQMSGPSVQQAGDLDGKAVKWLIGLTSLDNLNAPYRMQVKFGQQNAVVKIVDEPGTLDHGTELAHGYVFISVS